MDYKINEISDIKREVVFTIPAEELEREFNNEIINIQKRVVLKGFRKGKAPKDIIERIYADEARNDVSKRLIQKYAKEIFTKNNITPVGPPVLEEAISDGGFKVRLSFEIFPKIVPDNYKGITIKREKIVVDEKEVEAYLKELQVKHTILKGVEGRSARMGDLVIINYIIRDENKNKVEEKKDVSMVIGDERYYFELSNNIIGMNIGEKKDFEILFPDEEKYGSMKGKRFFYTFTLNSIKERILPEINDDFAKRVGKFENISDLKENIKSNIRKIKETVLRNKMEEEMIERIIEKNPFSVPVYLVDIKYDELKRDFLERYQRLPDQDEDKMIKRSAEYLVRAGIILDEIAKRENIIAEESEINKEIEEVAKRQRVKFDDLKERFVKNNLIRQFEIDIIRKKVINFLVLNSKIMEE